MLHRYEVKIKKKTACILEIAADIKARFVTRGRVQCGVLTSFGVLLNITSVPHGTPTYAAFTRTSEVKARKRPAQVLYTAFHATSARRWR